MKKYILILMAFYLVVGCKQESPATLEEPVSKFILNTQGPLNFDATGGEGEILFTIENPEEGVEPVALSSQEWISEIAVGESITFVVSSNESELSREATIEITYIESSFSVEIIQSGVENEPADPILTILTDAPLSIPASGGQYYIEYSLQNPVEGIDIEAESTQEWVIVNDNSFAIDNMILLNIEENLSTAVRTASLLIRYGEIEQEVVIEQDAAAGQMPELPENPISTLTHDVELYLDPNQTLVYADCFGDYYDNGLYCWGFYFMEVEAKQSLYIEVMTSNTELEIPTGVFNSSSDLGLDGALLPGMIIEDPDGLFNAYSWFTQLPTASSAAADAPIFYGSMEIIDNGDNSFKAIFNLIDDAGNAIIGEYTGSMIIEDFRM